jgi:UDP-glucose 4-epimerase
MVIRDESREPAGPMSQTRVLVTGGAGFIGTNLVRHLARRDAFEIVVLDNLSVGQSAFRIPPGVELRRGDYTDERTLAECLHGIHVVVHLAALSGVMDSIEDPRPSFEVNAVGTFRLLEAARRAEVRNIIVASTGGALLGEVTPPISEAMAPSPLSPYGASKLAVEGYCSAFAGAYGLACAALRFSNVYGPFSRHKKSVVAAFIKNALDGKPLVVYGDGTQQRDYLYVGDLVRGIETAMLHGVTGTYQLGSGKPTSLRKLIFALQEVCGCPLEVTYLPARRGEVHSTWCDISKAAQTFGFTAPTQLADGLRPTWEWFAENRVGRMCETTVASAD